MQRRAGEKTYIFSNDSLMPQFTVRYSNKMRYPGFVPDQSAIGSDSIIRGYNGRFWNDSRYYIPYGVVCNYSTRSRLEGGLVPIIPATKDDFFFRTVGIAVMTDTYDLYNFKDVIYPQHLKGFAPKQKVTLLHTGYIWLPVMSNVGKHDPVTYRFRPATGRDFKASIQKIGMFSNNSGTGMIKLDGEWLTDANAGEVALAHIKKPLDEGDPIIQGGDNPFDIDDPFG